MHSIDLAPNYYRVLGVPHTATFAEIKQTYRGLLLKHHPDKTTSAKSGSGIDLDLLRRAYGILSDPKSREEYDLQLRKTPPQRGAQAQSTPCPAQVVSIDLWNEVEDGRETIWTYPCRCGSRYVLREDDAEKDVHLVPCDGCSESLYAGYELQEES
jgi:diphthamide biosynthesis protein 4